MHRVPAWMLDLLGLTAAAYLAASLAGELLAGALGPPPRPALGRAAHFEARPPPRLDEQQLAQAFGWRASRPLASRPPRARLEGTLVGLPPAPAWALVRDDAGQHLCVAGDVLGGAVVEAIEPGAVRLRTASGVEQLELGGSQDPLPLGAPAPVDPTPLLFGARAVPALVNGVPVGLRVIDVQPASLYARAGLQSGDVVQRVGAYDARSIGTLIAHAGELLARDRVDIEVRRGDAVRELTLELRP